MPEDNLLVGVHDFRAGHQPDADDMHPAPSAHKHVTRPIHGECSPASSPGGLTDSVGSASRVSVPARALVSPRAGTMISAKYGARSPSLSASREVYSCVVVHARTVDMADGHALFQGAEAREVGASERVIWKEQGDRCGASRSWS